jgi:hypothetical protein
LANNNGNRFAEKNIAGMPDWDKKEVKWVKPIYLKKTSIKKGTWVTLI